MFAQKAFSLRRRWPSIARPDEVLTVFPPHQAKIKDFCQLLLKEKPLLRAYNDTEVRDISENP